MEQLAQATVAILAITNPVGAAVFFLGFTKSETSAQRRRLAFVATGAVVAILAGATAAGPFVLDLLGISLSAFRAGGGLLILLMGLEMLRGTPTRANNTGRPEPASPGATVAATPAAEVGEAAADTVLVPFAMPLVAGPGSIATVITLAAHDAATGSEPLPGVVSTLVAVGIAGGVLLLALLGADMIGRRVKDRWLSIVLRFLGVVLLAIGAQMVLSGVQPFVTTPAVVPPPG